MISFNNPRNKWIAIASLNLAFFAGLLFIKNGTTDSTTLNSRLDTIQSQLIHLQRAMQKPGEKIDLSSINQDFNKLTTRIEQLKTKEETQLNQLITENSTELTHKLDAIHQVMTSLDKKQHPITYLPASSLPFKVISIDSIQQVSVVSVTYDFKTIPMEKNDTLAGWTVLQIDFGKQGVEFINSNKEHVVVTLGDQNA